MRKKVVILGAGYAGIFAAANLCRAKIFDIILIDKNPYHLLLQQIPYVVSGEKDPEDITICLAELFSDEIAEGLLKIAHATIRGVDLMTKTITLEGVRAGAAAVAESLKYDYLIISLGAETHYFEIDGAEKHCLTFRSLQDAIKIRQKVESLSANSTVIVGGAGPSGLSLAAALSEMDVLREKELKIGIVDSAATILPGWDVRLAATSKHVLEAKGVQIITGEKIRIVTSNFLETESGKKIESDCTIWTAGVKGYGIPVAPEVERTNAGRIIVDRYSRIPAFENVFAIGDISAFKIVNIARKEKGHEMIDELNFSQRGHTILLGNKSLGLLSGLLVTGKMCEYAEDSIVDNFITEMKKKENGISSKAPKTIEHMEVSDKFSASFNFVTYVTSKAFLNLIM
jgi:NADH:ubiquinone reductase (H+-translocating)